MPNQQDFWKDFVDKRVQEALNPTLLRSAATSAFFISNTTTSVSTSQPLNSGLDFHYPHYHSWTLTGYEPKLKTRTRLPRHPHNHYYWRTCQTYV
jgi:hypothetical protein